jgi:RNA polymerase sigma-70 factor (sigma-E family)
VVTEETGRQRPLPAALRGAALREPGALRGAAAQREQVQREPAPTVAAEALDFDAYVRASGPRLKRLAFLLTGSLDTAEDLLQTAYAKVLPKWPAVSRYDDPDAYLRRIMVNTRTSWWRRIRDREISLAEPPEARQRTWRDVADDLGAHDELLVALRSLPPRQRAAVVLRHYCDLSELEAADVMGCSVGAVKSNTSRGLARLRVELGVPAAPVVLARPVTSRADVTIDLRTAQEGW